MFYLERFKRRWYSQKKLGYEKSSTCIYKERVVAPRTPGRVRVTHSIYELYVTTMHRLYTGT
ncbi:hypothetical protein T05_9140 [Trichinella murrelli]|uniref:Uncharacterized protein n=1 Tax=Trichinella murrelli TaxID=144512 RepID=A0A0V0SSM6_9BILA|nr:hypothetical protein T05_9140 [Trichinella murrelli]